MGSVAWMRIAALSMLPAIVVCGCDSPPPPPPQTSQATPISPVPAGAPPQRIIRFFVGIPMPPHNVLDVDRTVIVGGDSDWVGRIFFAVPMTVDQAIEFYQRGMPPYGWTELAVTRSDTTVLAYEMGKRIATIELRRQPSGGTQVEFWVNPLRQRDAEQAAQPAGPLAQSPPAVPSSYPRAPADGTMSSVFPPPRAVEQSPLPPPDPGRP